jgi:3-hydroxyisobutyrate dehydrogenase
MVESRTADQSSSASASCDTGPPTSDSERAARACAAVRRRCHHPRMRLGFVGLGRLGRHLAASLARAGFALTVHDRDETAAQPLVDAGAAWAPSPSAVAAASDSVFTCLPSPRVVADVVTAEAGLLEGLRPGGTWIDSSTNDRSELRRLADLAEAAGVHCLEAPVTGGVHLAASGRITVLVGGDPDVYAAHLPVFEAIGGQVFHIGALGSATVIKVITNMLAFIHLVAAGEALMLARRAGLDLEQSFDVIRASSGNSFVHETESQVILNGSYDIGFTIDLACKDLLFAHDLGREHGVPLELAGLVEQTFIRARAQYGGSAWSPMVVKLLEDALGTDLRAPGFPPVIEA